MSSEVAHQRLIREERALTDGDNLFGAWWEELDMDIKKAVVTEIDARTAANLIKEYEWLGTMPAIVSHCYGIYFDGALGGCVVYGPDYGENLGVWDRYGWTGKIILLARGACVHWAHEHAGSKLISQSMRMLPRKYEVVTATVDARAGEVGTIYQACNFHYLGPLGTTTKYGAIIKGKMFSNRNLRHLGIADKAKIREIDPDVEFVEEAAKGRYVWFRRNSKRYLSEIEDIVKPYPKRDS